MPPSRDPRPGLGSRAKGQSPDSRLSANPAFPLRRWPLRVRSPVTVAGPCRTRTGFLDPFTPCYVLKQHSWASSTRQPLRMQVRAAWYNPSGAWKAFWTSSDPYQTHPAVYCVSYVTCCYRTASQYYFLWRSWTATGFPIKETWCSASEG